MPIIPIQCPDSVLISLKETPENFAKQATKMLAIKLYGHITVPEAVKKEWKEGQSQGEDVPKLEIYPFLFLKTS